MYCGIPQQNVSSRNCKSLPMKHPVFCAAAVASINNIAGRSEHRPFFSKKLLLGLPFGLLRTVVLSYGVLLLTAAL